MTYERYENETDDELIKRIVSQKNEIGTWYDVADILNDLLGTNYDESTFRKKYKKQTENLTFALNDVTANIDNNYANFSKLQSYANSFKNYIDNKIKNNTDEFVLKDADRFRQIAKERVKLRTEKQEYNKWLREEARDEMIKDEITRAIHELKPLEIPKKIEVKASNKAWLLCFADCHVGIEFCIKDLFGNIINEYNPEIFQKRMWDLLFQVIDIIKKENISTLYVWDLSDSISGILRLNSQLMKLRMGIIDSAIFYGDFLSTWLNELSKHVKINFQKTADGNHDQLRICGAPKNSFPEENMSKVSMMLIKERLKENPNINIVENPTGMCYSQLTVWNALGLHGEVKNLKEAMDDYSRIYQVPIDYIIAGHLHHRESTDIAQKAEVLRVRSLVGLDDYSMSLRKVSDPGASLFCFDQIKGRTMEYSLKV